MPPSHIPLVVVTFSPSVTVQDPADVDDPRADLRSATLAASRDGRVLTVSATLQQPTSPTTPNWWRGLSTPRPGITWGLNIDPTSGDWQYVANLRGDPDLGAHGGIQRQHDGAWQLACPANASFDGSTYWLQFLTSCLDNPARVRFTAYVQLYDDSGSDIIGGDYAPNPTWASLTGSPSRSGRITLTADPRATLLVSAQG